MGDETEIEIRLFHALEEIGQAAWNACACPERSDGGRAFDPFTTYEFLHALETSGSVGDGTGWMPYYIGAFAGDLMIGCAPLYAKYHSQGEYVFDFSWADAYERAGGRYYPKLQIAVPFTPVTGKRLLTMPEHADVARAALVSGATSFARQNRVSSLHLTFVDAGEAEQANHLGLLHRTGQQFHWYNQNYQSFDDFLAALSSRKRKTLRKERVRANEFGGDIVQISGDDIQPHHWDAMWRFYQDTGARKWGQPYLTRAFFDAIHETMRDDILLIFAQRDGQPIAGAMNMIGRDALFGRYWGCIEDHANLHFEICYYRAIDYAIAHGLGRVEAGAQGEHKLARGYMPHTTHSLHWIADPGFEKAVIQYLAGEREAVAQDIEILTSYGPFKRGPQEEQD